MVLGLIVAYEIFKINTAHTQHRQLDSQSSKKWFLLAQSYIYNFKKKPRHGDRREFAHVTSNLTRTSNNYNNYASFSKNFNSNHDMKLKS